MSLIDKNSLLAAVSEEVPCGEDLEYDDPLFGEMIRAAQRTPEQIMGNATISAKEPDWNEVQAIGLKILPRSKDLRIAVYLAKAWVHTRSFEGLAAGLELILSLLQRYWDTLHPRLDPAEGNDPTERINTLFSLCDPGSMLDNIQHVTLVNFPGLGAKISFYDIQLGLGHLKPSETPDQTPLKKEVIDAAFKHVKRNELKAITSDVGQAIEYVDAIESFVYEKLDKKRSVDLGPLLNLLKQIHSMLMVYLQKRVGEGVLSEEHDMRESASTSETIEKMNETRMAIDKEPTHDSSILKTTREINKINNREDVIYYLDLACDYFKQHEPSSPVPLLLQRAKRLIDKDFIAILHDLTPAGVDQAKLISGITADD